MAWPRPDVELKPIGSAEHSRRMVKKHVILASPTALRELAERRRAGETYESLAAEVKCHPDYIHLVLIRSGLLGPTKAKTKTARQIARERNERR